LDVKMSRGSRQLDHRCPPALRLLIRPPQRAEVDDDRPRLPAQVISIQVARSSPRVV